MKCRKQVLVMAFLILSIAVFQCTKVENLIDHNEDNNPGLAQQGKEIFRYDAFGDEAFWSGVLHLDKAIAGKDNGGFGAGVNPQTALAVGLKVDADALPSDVVAGITSGAIKLTDPATTLALLKLNAVVGVKGNFDQKGQLQSIGITCASCHSTVDNSFAPGIGKRLDGWPNRRSKAKVAIPRLFYLIFIQED